MIKIRNILASVLSVGVAYSVAAVLSINRLAWIFVKGRYPTYRAILLISMALLFAIFGSCIRKMRFRTFAVFGIIAGYVAGLSAFFLLPWQHTPMHSLLSFKDITFDFFISPVITLSWVLGLMASTTAWLWIRNMVDPPEQANSAQ